MDSDRTIAEIEWLERIYAIPDTRGATPNSRPLREVDREAANQKHDEQYAENPWFKLWKRYGV